jgi:DNA topoisomerase-6 subunit B
MAKKENIHKDFREYSIVEFFKKNMQMLGLSQKQKALVVIVHEYVTNSLDACEEAGILPDIRVEIKKIKKSKEKEIYKVTVKDNGPGISKDLAPKAFGKLLTGTKFHRYYVSRGQQGIGAAACTMFSLITTGKPIYIKSGRDGKVFEMELTISKDNNPVILSCKEYEGSFKGLQITGYFGDVQYVRGKSSVYEYLRRTALANPHATITLVEPDGTINRWERTTNELIAPKKEAKLHPAAINTHDFLALCEITRAKTVKNMIVNDLSSTSQKTIEKLKELLKDKAYLLDISPKEIKWEDAELIVENLLKLEYKAPKSDVLISIGAENIENTLKNILKPSFVKAITRKPKVYRGGIPFLVEVGLAYGGEIQSGEIYRFANRVPLLFDQSACAITTAANQVNWKNYGLKDDDLNKLIVFVNVVSVHVPYTSTGKLAIDPSVEEITNEIKLAIMDCARYLKKHMNKLKKLKEIEEKKKVLDLYAPTLVDLLAKTLDLNEKEKETLLNNLKEMIEEKYKTEVI